MSHAWGNASAPMTFGAAQADHRHYQSQPGFDSSNFKSTGDAMGGEYGRFTPTIENLKTFFGEPSYMRKQALKDENDTGFYEKENSDYPEAFSRAWGSNGTTRMNTNEHIRRVLIEKTKASESWQLTRMAPWMYASGGLEYSWEEVKFNSHMLDREPEESTPRLTTFTTRKGQASMIRFGIAMLLEANFAQTPAGIQQYRMNIEQIRIATVETCSYGVMIAVLEREPPQDYDAPFRQGSSSSVQDLSQMFGKETAQWGIVHKNPKGYELVKGRLKKSISRATNGEEGNFTVVPQGMGIYLAETSDGKFYLDGRSNERNVSQLETGSHTLVESRNFSQGEHTEGHDPCFRHQTIGGFKTLDDSTVRNHAQYRTDMLDCAGYDGENDSLYIFRYADLYDKVGMWNFEQPNAPLTDHIGKGYAYDLCCHTWGHAIELYAGTPDRVYERLLRLSPEKQRELVASLLLLPKGDPRANPQQCGTNFDRREFDGMMSNTIEWDKTYTIPDRQALKRNAEEGNYISGRDMDALAFDEFQRKKARRLGRDTRSAQELWEESKDDYGEYTVDEGALEGMEVDATSGTITRLMPARRIVRTLRRPATVMTGGVASASSSRATALQIETSLLSLVGGGTKSAADAALVLDAPGAVARFTRLVMDMPGADDEDRLLMMRELERVVAGESMELAVVTERSKITSGLQSLGPSIQGEINTIVTFLEASEVAVLTAVSAVPAGNAVALGDANRKLSIVRANLAIARSETVQTMTYAKLVNVITANFMPCVARMQTKFARSQISSNLTPIELDATVDSAAGVWNPSATDAADEHEDGQVELAMSVAAKAGDTIATCPLESDAYAATLACDHDAIFHVPEATNPLRDLKPIVSKGMRQARTDALTWSIILSLIAAGRVKVGAAPVPADVLKRMRRVLASRPTTRVLPCQSHMTAAIEAARTIATTIATNGVFAWNPSITPLTYDDSRTQLKTRDVRDMTDVIRHGYKSVSAVAPVTGVAVDLTAIMRSTSGVPAPTPSLLDLALSLMATICSGSGRTSQSERVRHIIDAHVFAACHGDMARINGAMGPVVRGVAVKIYDAIRPYCEAKAALNPGAVALEAPSAGTALVWDKAAVRDLMHRASFASGSFHRFCVENDVPLCFALRLWRPSKTYNMGSVIRMVAGPNGAAKTM